jgi:mycothione reductase
MKASHIVRTAQAKVACDMKDFDVILVGTGSGMNIVSAMQEQNPDLKIAIIDKDEPGGICLTRGCIPSKL